MKKELKALLKAVKKCEKHGCFEHIDCAEDGGDFLYKAIENAERVLEACEESNEKGENKRSIY